MLIGKFLKNVYFSVLVIMYIVPSRYTPDTKNFNNSKSIANFAAKMLYSVENFSKNLDSCLTSLWINGPAGSGKSCAQIKK